MSKSDAIEVIGTAAALASACIASMFSDGRQSQLAFLVAGAVAGVVIVAVAGKVLGIDIGLPMKQKIAVHTCATIIAGPLSLNIALDSFPDYEPDAIACAVGGSVAMLGALGIMALSRWTKKKISTLTK